MANAITCTRYDITCNGSIEDDITKNMSKWKLRQLKEEKIRIVRNDIEKGIAKSVRKYYVSLPSTEAHHTTHPTGGVYRMAQKVHPKLLEKIHQLVSEGVTVVSEMKRALDHYVKYELCRDSLPDPNDRAYHPTNNDIKNHIYRAKSKLQLSKFDQENLRLKINEWQKTTPSTMFFFRPFKKKDAKEVLRYKMKTR